MPSLEAAFLQKILKMIYFNTFYGNGIYKAFKLTGRGEVVISLMENIYFNLKVSLSFCYSNIFEFFNIAPLLQSHKTDFPKGNGNGKQLELNCMNA